MLIGIPTLVQNTDPENRVYEHESIVVIYNEWVYLRPRRKCKTAKAIVDGDKVANETKLTCALLYRNETEALGQKIETKIFAEKTFIVDEEGEVMLTVGYGHFL